MASWEEMAEQVIILGRPGDVRGAAQGWQQLLQGCGEVKTSLENNVTDLNQGWKGPAYESFKTHIKAIAQQLDDMVKSAQVDDGIVGALNNAADKLEKAQQDMPVPAVCTADLIEARNIQASIPVGFFTLKLKSSLLSGIASIPLLSHAEYQLMDWINDKSGDARKVYDNVQGQYQDQTYRTPGTPPNSTAYQNTNPVTNTGTSGLNTGGGLGGLPGGGNMPKDPRLGANPPITGKLPGTGDGGLGNGRLGSGGLGGAGFDPSTGGGLAGAGDGLSGAGMTSGLGGAGGGLGGAGLGAGGLSGGGAAGKGMMPSMGGLMGGAGMGGGRGSAAGRRGAMAGGHGAGHGDSEDERTTWLQEDDDPWGTGDGATSGVLK